MKKFVPFFVGILAFALSFNSAGYAGGTRIRLFETSRGEEARIIADLIVKFQKRNPKIRVDYIDVPGRISEKVLVSAMAGAAPEVFPITAFDAPLLLSKEIAEPLNNLLRKSKINIKDFDPRLVNTFRFDDQIYGIPKKFDSLALFYNKDLFDKARVREPDDNWNWDDLYDASVKLAKRGVKYSIMFSNPVQNFLPFVFANGARILNEENTEALIDSRESVEALDFYTGLFRKRLSAFSANVGLGWAGQAFVNGQAAMVFEGSWLISYINKAKRRLNYGVVRMPVSKTGRRGNLFFAQAYSIRSGLPTRAKMQSLALINFLTSEESQNLWLESGTGFPSRQSFGNSSFLAEHPEYLKVYKGIEDGKPYCLGPRGEENLKALEEAIKRVYPGGENPQDALRRAAREINLIIRK